MSSASSATATGSRSPSPLTSDSSQSDSIPPNADFDLSSWFQSNMQKSLSSSTWNPNLCKPAVVEEGRMLHLDELIEQDAYEDSPPDVTFAYPSPPRTNTSPPPPESLETSTVLFNNSTFPGPSQDNHVSSIKSAPPPVPRPRKRESSPTNQPVVYPQKDSCSNLPIVFPNIPPGGTKSRVETQVRVTVELASSGSFSTVAPYNYERVGSWNWLKLPPGTATKKRTRKQGKIDPAPEDVLHLTANVTCSSAPLTPVLSCSSCQAREAKRVAKKVASRVRPPKSDSDSPSSVASRPHKLHKSGSGQFSQIEDTTSIIQFNCADTLDFSTGSVVLPLRITCYCRHHREKVGFNVHLSVLDSSGRVVGSGVSPPIMITDDHKTNANASAKQSLSTDRTPGGFGAVGSAGIDLEWNQSNQSQAGTMTPIDNSMTAPSKRKPSLAHASSQDSAKHPKRVKPYDGSRSNKQMNAPSPEDNLSLYSVESGSLTRPPTPPEIYSNMDSLDFADLMRGDMDVVMPSAAVFMPAPKPEFSSSQTSSPNPSQSLQNIASPYLFFPPALPLGQSRELLPPPLIHRLIPAHGPTHGGIEITILGANFHPSFNLKCVFGDVVAGSTQRWSDNALVCVLPPRESAGIVGVWFDGWKNDDTSQGESIFTYSDESDRALMELALQVVGLKMTGKIEDAKNVAMRIVGGATSAGDDPQHTSMGSSSSTVQMRELLLLQSRESPDFESLIVNFLGVLDLDEVEYPLTTTNAFLHCTSSGQTLLHLATFLGLPQLVRFLIVRGIDLDTRDRNGYTALHFATLLGGDNGKAISELLLESGADREIVNILGRTAEENSANPLHSSRLSDGSDADRTSSEDEEAAWGDGEEEAVTLVVRRTRKPRKQLSESQDSLSPTHLDLEPNAHTEVAKIPLPDSGDDAKQTAWFVNMLQRTFAQLHIPANMPQLLPPKVAVTTDHGQETVGKDPGGDHGMGAVAIRAAQEWKNSWEKWLAQAVATIAKQSEEMPPPMYTPRIVEEEGRISQDAPAIGSMSVDISTPIEGPSSLPPEPRQTARQVGYGDVAIPDVEVDSYAYQPSTKRAQKLKKKQDRMLLLFWLPILLIALLWGFHEGVQFTFHAVRKALPMLYPLGRD